MAQDGKMLEKLVNIVEEVYRSNPETEILPNYKIQNIDGNKREFDLIIKSNNNGFSLTIAIECKQYTSKVSVDKIEAFYTKCLGVPEIDKKVFISENGFQKGAIDTAKRYGIELFTFGEVEETSRQILFDIKRMKPIFKGFEIVSAACENNPFLGQITINDINTFRSVNGKDSFDYYELILLGIKPKWATINTSAIVNWMKTGETHHKIDFSVTFEGIYFEYRNTKIAIKQIDCLANIELTFIETSTVEKSYLNLFSGEAKAKTLSFALENVEGSIVVDREDNLHIFDTTDKDIKKLEVLFSYNDQTGKFEKPDTN